MKVETKSKLTNPEARIAERPLNSLVPLQSRPAFRAIYLTCFRTGVESAGLVGIPEWKTLRAREEQSGEFLGVDQNARKGHRP